MITLADLRARNALPSWQESVAIVQELVHATVTARGSAARLPDIGHIGLGADGSIALLAGGDSPQNPVRHLAVLLDLLLEDVTAPDQLAQIVKRNIDDPPEAQSVEELAKSLAFFERPGRRDDIARLVARAAVAEEQTRADEELKRLKMRALQAERPREEDLPPAAAPRRSMVVPFAAAGTVLVLALAASVYLWSVEGTASPSSAGVTPDATTGGTSNDPPGTAGKEAEHPASLLSRVGTAVRNAAASLTGSSQESEVALPEPVPPAPPEAAHAKRRRSLRTPSHAALMDPMHATDGDETDPVMIITTELGGRPLDPSPAPEPETDALFTSGDLDVLPPTIVRPVIPPPPLPNAPAASKALFDVVVDRKGRVEQVQLASSPTRFHERMILSHIKAWTFQPAVKDGRPVRYRLRVLLSV
jgi:hypothetical protein